MADDERRAEIEAVAAEARDIASVVANDEKFHRIETLIDQLEDAALNRARDARGDDEAAREPSYEAAMAEWQRNAEGWERCRAELAAARSPQDEDHEAGSFTIRWDDSMGCYRVSIPNYEGGEVVPIEVHRAALSRVSPSRDGTVAVEDVERLTEALRLISEHARLDESERGIVEASRYYGIAEHALAEFARPATGEQTDHGGNQ